MSVEKLTLRRRRRGWRSQIVQLLAIVLVVFLAKGAIAEPFYVPSGSMEPTLQIGDAMLASKYPYGYSTASLPMQINLPETKRVFGEMPKREQYDESVDNIANQDCDKRHRFSLCSTKAVEDAWQK